MLVANTPFLWGIITVFIATIFFYIGAMALMYYWHDKKTTFVILPLLFTFDFFLICSLVLGLLFLVLQYSPEAVTLLLNYRI